LHIESEIRAAQTHVGVTTVMVAFAAEIAGMLAVETRAGAAIDGAISVAEIPAAAYLGVAIAIGTSINPGLRRASSSRTS
jgi:hypothetical protein